MGIDNPGVDDRPPSEPRDDRRIVDDAGRRQNAEAGYREAVQLPAVERAAFLDSRCSDDPGLRRDIEVLLAAFDSDDGDDLPTIALPVDEHPAFDPAGDNAVRRSTEAPEVPDYDLCRVIGAGAFGEVWLARNRHDLKFCAIKLIEHDRSLELEGIRHYKLCVEDHPNLLPILHVGHVDSSFYAVMPLADNASGSSPLLDPSVYEPMTLRTHLNRRGRLPPAEAIQIADDLLQGLEHLHKQGAVHGDVKPANVMRHNGVWRLGDHGLVLSTESTRARGHTPVYTPPEGPAGRVSDLYAVGVILFELLTGLEPGRLDQSRQGPGPLNELPDGDRLARVIDRATDSDPERRFESAAVMREAISKPPSAGRNGRRRWPMAAMLALLAIVATIAVAIARSSGSGPVPPLPLDVLVEQHDEEGNLIRTLGLGGLQVGWRKNQSARLEVDFLGGAGHCMIIALETDGQIKPFYPGDAHEPPPAVSGVTGPHNPAGQLKRWRIDNAGTQGFAVLASSHPLPAFAELEPSLRELPWRMFRSEVGWKFDGVQFVELESDRSLDDSGLDVPDGFVATIKALRKLPEAETVHGVCFPVGEGKE